jgi:Gp37 protein
MNSKLPVLADPTAWGGRVYDPPLSLDLATLQDSLVEQLRGTFDGTNIEVHGFPDQPDNTWWNSDAIGYLLVAYDKTEYSAPLATSSMVQERRVDFEVLIIARQISWADFNASGVFKALNAVIKSSLTGFRAPGWRNGYFSGENFREKDPRGRVWVYSMRFRAVTMEIKQEPTLALANLKEVLFREVAGVTATPVPAAPFIFDETGTIQLPLVNISAVRVTSANGATTYVLGADYAVQSQPGQVSVIAGGALAPGVPVNVAYSYSDVVTASSSGGPAPFNPSN